VRTGVREVMDRLEEEDLLDSLAASPADPGIRVVKLWLTVVVEAIDDDVPVGCPTVRSNLSCANQKLN
jgi:hypothetical protein